MISLYVSNVVLVGVLVQAADDGTFYCSPQGETNWGELELQTWDGMDNDHFYLFPDYAQNAVLRIQDFGNSRCQPKDVKIYQQGSSGDTPKWVCCV